MITLHAGSFIGVATNQPLGNSKIVGANAVGTVTATFFPVYSAGETVGTGNGVLTTFTLSNIPILADSQSVFLDGVLKTETTDYTINDTTGVITFLVAPANGVVVTANYSGTISKTQSVAATQEIEVGGLCTGITSTASVTIS